MKPQAPMASTSFEEFDELHQREPGAEDRELIEQLDRRRRELATAADVLQRPLRAVNRTDALIRRVTPALPYAIAAITVVGIAGRLMRGRRVRPSLLIATGLDLWRLWKGINAVALLSTAKADAGSPRYPPIHQETLK